MKQSKLLFSAAMIFVMLFAACANSPASQSEEVIVSVDYATDKLLKEYDSFTEFTEFEGEGFQEIIFTTNVAASNFKFIEVGYKEEDSDIILFGSKVLYSLGELSPEKPFKVTWMEQGTIPHRGISYTDETGATKYFYITMSGEDGSLFLVEFMNE
jgi:hypothetical protein